MSNFLKGTLKVVGALAVVLFIVAAVMKLLFVDLVVVAHNGMAPTIVAGDEILVWRNARPEHGSIVLCRHPQQEGRLVLARVMAVEGSSIAMDRAQLMVGRTRVAQDLRGTVDFFDVESGDTLRMRWGWEELGNDDHMFFQRDGRQVRLRAATDLHGLYLLSDNRTHVGEDSRTYGVVQAADCLGVAFMRGRAVDGVPDEIPHGHLDLLD